MVGLVLERHARDRIGSVPVGREPDDGAVGAQAVPPALTSSMREVDEGTTHLGEIEDGYRAVELLGPVEHLGLPPDSIEVADLGRGEFEAVAADVHDRRRPSGVELVGARDTEQEMVEPGADVAPVVRQPRVTGLTQVGAHRWRDRRRIMAARSRAQMDGHRAADPIDDRSRAGVKICSASGHFWSIPKR